MGEASRIGPAFMTLDDFDLKILIALQREGRMTKLRLAQEIGLSPSPCWERLRRLEKHGFIRGFHARVDLDRLLHTSTVLVEVTLGSHYERDFERFEVAVQAVPEIVECYATGGGVDYLLKLIVLDIEHYQQLIDHLLADDIGIERYFTYIVTKEVKRADGPPLRRLLEVRDAAIARKRNVIRRRRERAS